MLRSKTNNSFKTFIVLDTKKLRSTDKCHISHSVSVFYFGTTLCLKI